MRNVCKSILISLLAFSGTQAYACSLAPDYQAGEFGSDGVVLGDIGGSAHKILIGRFVETKHPNPISFHVTEDLTHPQSKSNAGNIRIKFRDVEKDHTYFYNGKDKRQIGSFAELKSVVRALQPKWFEAPDANIRFGSGGPLAEIFHGSDCERTVLIYSEQDYLVFLDSENIVQASFPIKSVSDEFLQLSKTLFENPVQMKTSK